MQVGPSPLSLYEGFLFDRGYAAEPYYRAMLRSQRGLEVKQVPTILCLRVSCSASLCFGRVSGCGDGEKERPFPQTSPSS